MKIEISKDDLMDLRHLASRQVYTMEHCPNPAAWGDIPKTGRKFIRKLNAALKKVHGHDCMGDTYLHP